MKHPYRIREIAAQAGLSQATVDRVLHLRGGVRERVAYVEERAEAVHDHTRAVLAANPSVRAVYSLYAGAGGNAAVVAAFAAERRNYDVFVAHDLDDDNTALLRSRKLSAVLHHDLRADLRRACVAIMQAQGVIPGPIRANPAAIQVITPFNTPPIEF